MPALIHTLDEVKGHQGKIQYLKRCLQEDNLPQILLLHGNTGLGKTSIAKVIACEVAYYGRPAEEVKAAKQAVIDEEKNTDCVKVFNMSTYKSTDNVEQVRGELNIGLSSTGRKVVVMDEAHGLSEDAQDSFLTAFNMVPTGLYVILCTTEVSGFKDTFLSRMISIRLGSLSSGEMKDLLRGNIAKRKLKFELGQETVIHLIADYTGNEPRAALKLLDCFKDGSIVKTQDLEVFINVDQAKELIWLVKYLYGNMLLGIEYVQSLVIDNTFISTLIDILRVALGGSSPKITRESSSFILEIFRDNDISNLLGFTTDVVNASYNLSKNRLTGLFLKWNVEYQQKVSQNASKPVLLTTEQVKQSDILSMADTLQKADSSVSFLKSNVTVDSLEKLFNESETVDG